MTRPKIADHNITTDEVIVREMNDAEFAQYQIDQAETTAHQEALTTKATARQELLERLGITAEESKLLLN